MKKFLTQTGTAFTLLGILLMPACSPKQNVADPDECPEVNYNVTELKDAQFIGMNAAIDNEVTSRMAGKFPGCAVGIADAGEIVYLKGYGAADLGVLANPADDVPFTVNTVAGIGSVSKVLTAIAVMRLEELGHVDLDQSLASHFPYAVPGGWNLVTVRDVLSHRAGFARDPDGSLPGAITPAGIDASFGEPHASQHPRYAMWEFLLTTQGTPNVPDIGTYSYSNIGYTILGAMVDQITVDPGFSDGPAGYENYVWSLVSGAQDACLTGCLDHHWRFGDIPNEAASYSADWLTELNPLYSGWQGPAGGWSMTIGDLTRVLLALGGNQILSQASLDDMRTNPGIPGSSDYGLGLFLEDKAGQTAYSHGGRIAGFRTQVIVWPEEDVAVAAFCNADRTGVGAIAENVGDVYMASNLGGGIGEGIGEGIGGGTGQALPGTTAPPTQSAAYTVSKEHFAGLEKAVRPYVDRYGEDAASYLIRLLKAQGQSGQMLVDFAQRGEVETASQIFLQILQEDGYVGPYRPEK